MKLPRAFWPAALALLCAAGLNAAPPGEAVPGVVQAALIVRILAYDHRLAGRPPGPAVIAILQSGSGVPAVAPALERLLANGGLPGREVRIALVPFRGDAQLAASLAILKPAALFVPRSLDAEAGRIARATRAAQVLSIGESDASVRAGLSLGIVRRKARASLIVQRAALHAEGAELDAALLRLCDPVEGEAR